VTEWGQMYLIEDLGHSAFTGMKLWKIFSKILVNVIVNDYR
jgi:hypothetical protein